MIEEKTLTVETTLKAILVLEETGEEHNGGERLSRRCVDYGFRAVYVPALAVLATERVIAPRGGKEVTTPSAEIVADHAAAVRRAVALADETRAAAKAEAMGQR